MMMYKPRTLLLILLFFLVAASLAVACAGEEQAPQPSAPIATPEEPPASGAPPTLGGAELLEQRCTPCHGLDLVERANKTAEEWETTVERMRGMGAELTDEEVQILIEYLAETYGP
jgi:cytochrome c5